jgi:Uma2 family endonuclease
MSAAAVPIARHKLTATDYHRMADVGILAPDARVELIQGEIFDMAPIGSRHGSVVDKLTRLFDRTTVKNQAIVRVQGSVHLNRYTEPQPDIALLRFRSDFYENQIPSASDIVLLIEVADSTLAYDRDVKAPLYARAGIPEYWLVDLEQRRIVFHREPVNGEYRQVDAAISPGITPITALEAIAVDLNGLL